jgi:hypothetical protein
MGEVSFEARIAASLRERQLARHPRESGDPMQTRHSLRRSPKQHWIPAFAGMTEEFG